MSMDAVRAALVVGYNAALAVPAVPPTEWENAVFDPSGETLWTSVIFVPAQPTPATLGDNGEDEMRGFLQVDINVLNGSGEKALLAIQAKLEAYFIAGRSFAYDGGFVTVISCGISSGRKVDAWFRRSSTINFYARTNRGSIT